MRDDNVEPFGFIVGEDDVLAPDLEGCESALLVTDEVRDLLRRAYAAGHLVVRASSEALRDLVRRGYFVSVEGGPGESVCHLTASGRELAGIIVGDA